jgi:hypothetical protein
MSSVLPWQIRLGTIFTDTLTPEQVERITPFWHANDLGIHSPDQNLLVRLRDYTADGHPTRQELLLGAGEQTGITLRGKDAGSDYSSVITYGDVLLHVGQTFHVQVPKNNFLWNSCPINPILNANFTLPPGISQAETVFQFAKAQTPGAATLGAVKDQMNSISATTGLNTPGFADFTDPYQTYLTLTPQKIPLWNYAAITFMQLLFKSPDLLFLSAAPGLPIIPSPLALGLMPQIRVNYQPLFNAGVLGKVLGDDLKRLLQASVPGLSLLG